VRPYELACGRIDRDDRTTSADGRIQHAAHHQRRALQILLRPRTEVLGLESPRDLERVEIVRVDLVERGVPRVGEIAAVGRPLAVFGADLPDLADGGQRRPDAQACQRKDRQPPPTNRLPHDASVISYRGRSPSLYTINP
jgi:hypothetical protein